MEPCRVDADCVATNFAGCCACPQCRVAEPHARNRDNLAKEVEDCAVVECSLAVCNLGGMCPPGEDANHFRAVCQKTDCVLVRR